MNVQLLPAALDDIAVLRAAGFRGTGLLLGTEIGRFVLVERLLPLDLAPRQGGGPLAAACARYGDRLLGVFFCRRPPVALDPCIGGLVLKVGSGEIQAFTCGFDASRKRARLAPLPEDAEATWPS